MSNKLLCLLVILDLVIQKMVKTVVAKFSYFLVRFIPPICTIDETSDAYHFKVAIGYINSIINQFQLVDYKENIKQSTIGGVCRNMIQLHEFFIWRNLGLNCTLPSLIQSISYWKKFIQKMNDYNCDNNL